MGKTITGIGLILLLAASGLALANAGDVQGEDPGSAGLYQPEGRRDPFSPLVRDGRVIVPVQSATNEKGLAVLPVLHGILWDAGGHSLAIIDDVEVQAGQVVRGYQVVEIRRDAVILDRNGKHITVPLNVEEHPSTTKANQTQGGGDRP